MLELFQKRKEDSVKIFPKLWNGKSGVDLLLNVAKGSRLGEVNKLLSIKEFFSSRFMVAHRLGGTDFPEHTEVGMKTAIANGFKAFEFSTYRTKDSVFAGAHDWTTARTTGVYHEIWDTEWAVLSQLEQKAGRMLSLQEAVALLPEDGILVLDHKATSNGGDSHLPNLESEAELFRQLDELFEKPQERVVWKVFSKATSAQRAKEKGYTVMCMLYPADLEGATYEHWDILGMEWNASQDVWDQLNSHGKPTIAHIITSKSQADTAFAKGATGLMSSVPTTVHP